MYQTHTKPLRVCVLQEFILNQDWNDPKSQLQQCCLTLRTEGKEPDIPLYKYTLTRYTLHSPPRHTHSLHLHYSLLRRLSTFTLLHSLPTHSLHSLITLTTHSDYTTLTPYTHSLDSDYTHYTLHSLPTLSLYSPLTPDTLSLHSLPTLTTFSH